jgi:hypothetical protein
MFRALTEEAMARTIVVRGKDPREKSGRSVVYSVSGDSRDVILAAEAPGPAWRSRPSA